MISYVSNLEKTEHLSSVKYPAIWRCDHISRGRCGRECGGCASLKEMIHPQWTTTASPEEDAASPAGDVVSLTGDLLASPNFGICDTTRASIGAVWIYDKSKLLLDYKLYINISINKIISIRYSRPKSYSIDQRWATPGVGHSNSISNKNFNSNSICFCKTPLQLQL
jgi:hypothetical protein